MIRDRGVNETRTSCPQPNVIDLIMGEQEGGRTVQCGDVWYQFEPGAKSMGAIFDGVITEDPDKVAGRFRRWDHSFFLFIGDQTGTFVTKGTRYGDGATHGHLLRLLRASGKVVRPDPATGESYRVVDDAPLPDGVTMVGSPSCVSPAFSGVIMPKQDGVDGSYVSYWTKQAELRVLNQYVIDNFPGPHFVERSASNSMGGPFTVAEL